MVDLTRLAAAVSEPAQRLAQWGWDLLPFGTGSRLHWTGLVAFLLIGTALWLFARRSGRPESRQSLIAFLFPRHMYFSQSSLVDVKVYLANRLIGPFTFVTGQTLRVLLATSVAVMAAPVFGTGSAAETSLGILIAAGACIAVVSDFATYWVHRLHHENPLLWPFHKLHHSAEHLTPLTLYRKHPVYDFISSVSKAVCVGPVIGLVFAAFGIVSFHTIFGVSLTLALFNLAGSNLRHSHIWLDYGPVLSRVFSSPAQHQIHHSCDPRHHDKNYGELLAIWDWMFGTLYIPEGREELTFGVADRNGVPEPQVHTSLASAWLVPFSEAGEALRARSAAARLPAE